MSTRRILESVTEAARHHHHLVDDMLLLTAIETAEELGHHSQIQLQQLLVESVSSLQKRAAARRIAWDITADEPVTVRCDAYAIARALHAILQSALERAALGSVLHVSLRADEHFAILAAFFRGGEGPSSNADLRLGVARSVVTAHHGTLSVHVHDEGLMRITLVLPVGRPQHVQSNT
jgi:signal transduction histidine kinase